MYCFSSNTRYYALLSVYQWCSKSCSLFPQLITVNLSFLRQQVFRLSPTKMLIFPTRRGTSKPHICLYCRPCLAVESILFNADRIFSSPTYAIIHSLSDYCFIPKSHGYTVCGLLTLQSRSRPVTSHQVDHVDDKKGREDYLESSHSVTSSENKRWRNDKVTSLSCQYRAT